MAKAMYDQNLVDRLIEKERKRMPLASLDELCRQIIENWGQEATTLSDRSEVE